MIKEYKYNGNLIFNNNGEYAIFEKGNYIEIEKEFNKLLMSEIHIRIIDNSNKNILFDGIGRLSKKNDLGKSIYRLFIDDFCLDEVLFSLSDREFNNTRIEFVRTKELKYKNTLDLEVV